MLINAAGGCLSGVRRHAFAYDAFHPNQADSDLVLNQFANGADASVAQMVDVVGNRFAVVDLDHAFDDVDKVEFG